MLAERCNSFCAHRDYLLYTSTTHKMHFVALNAKAAGTDSALSGAAQWAKGALIAEPRNVERGAELVACVEDGTRVVLQMPRGNLEVVDPRPLLFVKLAELMDR